MEDLIDFFSDVFCESKECHSTQEDVKVSTLIDISLDDGLKDTEPTKEDVLRLKMDSTNTKDSTKEDLTLKMKNWDRYVGKEIEEADLRDRVVFLEGFFCGSLLLQLTLSNCFSTHEMWGKVYDFTYGRNVDYIGLDDRSRRIMKRNNTFTALYSTKVAITPWKLVQWVLNNIQNGIPMIVSSNMKEFFSYDDKNPKFLNRCVITEARKDAVCKCGKYAIAVIDDTFLCNEHSKNFKNYDNVFLYLPLLINVKCARSYTELQCFNYPIQFSSRRGMKLPTSSGRWTTVMHATHPKPILTGTGRCVIERELHNILHKIPGSIDASSCFQTWDINNGGTKSTVEKIKCILRKLVFQ